MFLMPDLLSRGLEKAQKRSKIDFFDHLALFQVFDIEFNFEVTGTTTMVRNIEKTYFFARVFGQPIFF